MHSMPLVSCILPTRDRPRFVEQSVRYWQSQTYRETELVVVDSGSRPVAALMPNDRRVRYTRAAAGLRTGAARNLACEHTTGELIAHWDDDDWMRADRL